MSGLGSSASKALTSGISWVAFQAIATIGGIHFIYRRIAGSGEDDRFSSEKKKKDRSILARTLLRHPRE